MNTDRLLPLEIVGGRVRPTWKLRLPILLRNNDALNRNMGEAERQRD